MCCPSPSLLLLLLLPLLLLLLMPLLQSVPEDLASQELQPDAPCELCTAAGGEQAVRWGKPVIVRRLPRWPSWQQCTRLGEMDRSKQTVRVQMTEGPSKQVCVLGMQLGGGGSQLEAEPETWLKQTGASRLCVCR
jgi:hypothetical protein